MTCKKELQMHIQMLIKYLFYFRLYLILNGFQSSKQNKMNWTSYTGIVLHFYKLMN